MRDLSMLKKYNVVLLVATFVLFLVGCSGKGYINETKLHQSNTSNIDNLLVISKLNAFDFAFGDNFSKSFDERFEGLLAAKGVRTKVVVLPVKSEIETVDLEKIVRESDLKYVMFLKFGKFEMMQSTVIGSELSVQMYDKLQDKLIWSSKIHWYRGSRLFQTDKVAGSGLAETVFESMQRDLVLGK